MSVWGNILDRGAGKKRKENEIVFLDSAEIRPTELAEMMRKGIVHFQYRKKAKKGQPAESGVIRDAWGTKQSDVITKVPHGGECPPKRAGYTIYFDLEQEDWRAFLDDRLIGVWNKVYDEDEFHTALAEFKKKEED